MAKYYYVLTVPFALVDWIFGENVRVVAFEGHPDLRTGYYVACIACAGVLHLRPTWSGLVTLGESTLNLTTLILSIFLPYYALIESVSRGEILAGNPITPNLILNFVIAGSAAVAAFHWRLAGVR